MQHLAEQKGTLSCNQHFLSHPFPTSLRGSLAKKIHSTAFPTDTRGRGKHGYEYKLTDSEGDKDPPRPLLRIKAATCHPLLPRRCRQCPSPRAAPHAQPPPLLTARRMECRSVGTDGLQNQEDVGQSQLSKLSFL